MGAPTTSLPVSGPNRMVTVLDGPFALPCFFAYSLQMCASAARRNMFGISI